MLYFTTASPSSTAVADIIEMWLFFQKQNDKALKNRTSVCVCFVADGVIFLIRYVIHSFYISPNPVQGTEQLRRNHIE